MNCRCSAAIDDQNERNQYLKDEIAELDKQIAEIHELEQQKQRLLARMQVIEQLERSRPEIVHVFDQLVRTMPDGVYLTSLKQTDRKIQLKGLAQSSTRVASYMRNIDVLRMADRSRARHPGDQGHGRRRLGVHAERDPGESAAVRQPGRDRSPRATGRSAPMSNFVDQIRDLDPNDPGRWPLPFRLGAIGLIFLIAAVAARLLPGVEAEEAGARRRARRGAGAAQHARAEGEEGRESGRLQGAAGGDGAVLRRDAAQAAEQDRSAEPADRYFAAGLRRRPRSEAVPAERRRSTRTSTPSCRSRCA